MTFECSVCLLLPIWKYTCTNPLCINMVKKMNMVISYKCREDNTKVSKATFKYKSLKKCWEQKTFSVLLCVVPLLENYTKLLLTCCLNGRRAYATKSSCKIRLFSCSVFRLCEDTDLPYLRHAPQPKIFSISCSFFLTFGKIVSWRPQRVGNPSYLPEILDPPLVMQLFDRYKNFIADHDYVIINEGWKLL